MIKLTKESGESANFSIILPGACNAKCSFCFWKRSTEESPMFTQQLTWYLKALGDKVTQVSITGGEPTLSPMFADTINVLREFDVKVVLTTNGTALISQLASLQGVVNHINISRHCVGDESNKDIFGTEDVPNIEELTDICYTANTYGIDVTLNKVVSSSYNNVDEFNDYIQLIKQVGASALAIRKDYSVDNLDKLPLEEGMNSVGVSRTCPVCSTNSYIYSGVPVHFKMSLEEPSDTLPYIYEFIYHPNGSLTEDWLGVKPVIFKQVDVVNVAPLISRQYSNTSGCGQLSTRSSGC